MELPIEGDRPLRVLQKPPQQQVDAQAGSDGSREAQAARIRDTLTERYDPRRDYVAVCGDFNDVPESGPLPPLLLSMPNLKADPATMPKGDDPDRLHPAR